MASLKLSVFALIIFSCDGHLDPPPAVSRIRYWAITTRLDSSTSLTASHTLIQGDRPVYVSASWTDLPASLDDSWVGLYLAQDDATQVVPLKYSFCNASSTRKNSSSEGSLLFRILNYRGDVLFRLFHGWDHPVLISQSKVVAVRFPGHPTGVRLSLTGVMGEIAVTWTSTRNHAEGASVKYDIFDSEGNHLKKDMAWATEHVSYGRRDLCGPPATAEGFRDPGFFFTATIPRLHPGWVLRYQVGSEISWSRNFSFRAPPAAGSRVKIFAFGDLGEHPADDTAQGQGEPWYSQDFAFGDPGTRNTTKAMLADHRQMPADLVLHNGDLSYAMGYSSMWDVFHDNIEPLSAEIPWMVTMGNHERDWPGTNSTQFGGVDSMGECGVPTMRRFAALPFASSRLPPNDQPWYAFNIGVVAIFAVSTEHDIAAGSAQHSWLTEALGAVNRQMTPWVVLAGHRPIIVDSPWSSDKEFASYFQKAVGYLLERHRVDLILGGHHHSYQRSCSYHPERCTEGGTVVLNVGMAGAGLNKINATVPPTFLYVDDTNFGYSRIVADNTSLTADFVVSATQVIHDSITLWKRPQVVV